MSKEKEKKIKYSVILSDQPTFLKRPTNVQADMDEIVYLYCEVDANPPSEIIWVFDPIDRVYKNYSKWTIKGHMCKVVNF